MMALLKTALQMPGLVYKLVSVGVGIVVFPNTYTGKVVNIY